MIINKIRVAIPTSILVFLFSSCILFGENLGEDQNWNLKNCTSDTLTYVLCERNQLASEIRCPPGKWFPILLNVVYSTKDIVEFDYFLKFGYDSILIKREDKIIRTWRLSESEKEGKQLFNESSWIHKDWSDWTFEIHPEDLIETEKVIK